MSNSKPISLTILTGFLGAGKTTLLKRILTGDHGLRVAVLVNDFGAINIDADLVVSVDSDVVNLSNGCVCCSIRDDLLSAVTQVIGRSECPEFVLLEASGVADPAGIAMTFLGGGLSDCLSLDSIICVVDAEQVFKAPEQMQLKLWQIATSDLLVLNKVDLVTQEEVERIENWLDKQLHRYRLIQAKHCNVPLEILLSSGRFDATHSVIGREDHDRNCKDSNCENSRNSVRRFSSWSYETVQPLSLEALENVARSLPTNIYRCKGVIYSADAPGRRTILQVVGKRVTISQEDAWEDRTPRTRLLLIGAAGSLDEHALQRTFDSCIAKTCADTITVSGEGSFV